MKKTLINIWAYSHHAKFEIEHEFDTAESVENAILDKLGEKSINGSISEIITQPR